MAVKKDALAKELYIKGFDLPKIAEILGRTEKTISNYKSKDGTWDELRASNYLNKNQDDKTLIYENFMEEMYLAVKEVRNSDLKPEEKTVAFARLGDSFSKMKKIASFEDPESYKLAIVKRVIQVIVNEFKQTNNLECVKSMVTLIESKEFVESLGKLDV